MITKKIELDVWNYNSIMIATNTGEHDSKSLEISFLNGDTPFDLTDKTVFIYAERPDNIIIWEECQVYGNPSDGKVIVQITAQMSNFSGITNCEFHISEGENDGSILKVLGLKLISNECIPQERLSNKCDRKSSSSILKKSKTPYEFGKWIPKLYGFSSDIHTYIEKIRNAFYYRIQKICYISLNWNIEITDVGTSNFIIGGLPYSIDKSNKSIPITKSKCHGTALFESPTGDGYINNNYIEIMKNDKSKCESEICDKGYIQVTLSGFYPINETYCQ